MMKIANIDAALHDPLCRRALLLHGTQTLAAIGLVATAWPFVRSLEPSEQARAEGSAVDVSWADLAIGQLHTVEWRGQPVWLMRRSPEMLAALQQPNPVLADPQSARSQQPAVCRNAQRSLTPELFVAVGLCTHLGCSPTLHLGDPDFDAAMHGPGGFVCPCHGSRFDLAGRVVRNVPAPTNLDIPPYTLQADQRLRIG